jgi:hypothetical protein
VPNDEDGHCSRAQGRRETQDVRSPQDGAGTRLEPPPPEARSRAWGGRDRLWQAERSRLKWPRTLFVESLSTLVPRAKARMRGRSMCSAAQPARRRLTRSLGGTQHLPGKRSSERGGHDARRVVWDERGGVVLAISCPDCGAPGGSCRLAVWKEGLAGRRLAVAGGDVQETMGANQHLQRRGREEPPVNTKGTLR